MVKAVWWGEINEQIWLIYPTFDSHGRVILNALMSSDLLEGRTGKKIKQGDPFELSRSDPQQDAMINWVKSTGRHLGFQVLNENA